MNYYVESVEIIEFILAVISCLLGKRAYIQGLLLEGRREISYPRKVAVPGGCLAANVIKGKS